ncbi:hypothetical protein J2858_003094 [Neorhizobium galegae]|uniref:hypothetical protein n=1 Tax=Neorhizobium galegae TaxID=399 RepID=UPI001AE1119B|nr:hypothetical protein [Neorhizobium galegae]MBP2550158.1 hypothetical protein [Neorhizobium galegae]
MEQLANLPPLALMTFGATIAIIFAVRHLGLLAGSRASPATSPAAAQVAAVIVDPTALNRATAVLEDHTAEMHRVAEIGERLARAHEIVGIELGRVREEMRLERELRRAQRRDDA